MNVVITLLKYRQMFDILYTSNIALPWTQELRIFMVSPANPGVQIEK